MTVTTRIIKYVTRVLQRIIFIFTDKEIVLVRIQVQVTKTLHKLTEAKKECTGSCK